MKLVHIELEHHRQEYVFQLNDIEILSAPQDIRDKLDTKKKLPTLEALSYFAGKDFTRGDQ